MGDQPWRVGGRESQLVEMVGMGEVAVLQESAGRLLPCEDVQRRQRDVAAGRGRPGPRSHARDGAGRHVVDGLELLAVGGGHEGPPRPCSVEASWEDEGGGDPSQGAGVCSPGPRGYRAEGSTPALHLGGDVGCMVGESELAIQLDPKDGGRGVVPDHLTAEMEGRPSLTIHLPGVRRDDQRFSLVGGDGEVVVVRPLLDRIQSSLRGSSGGLGVAVGDGQGQVFGELR